MVVEEPRLEISKQLFDSLQRSAERAAFLASKLESSARWRPVEVSRFCLDTLEAVNQVYPAIPIQVEKTVQQ